MLELHFNNVSLENCNLYVCEGRYKGMRQLVSAHLIVKGTYVREMYTLELKIIMTILRY